MAEFNASFFERGMDVIPVMNQVDADTDVDGDWIKLRDYDRVLFLIAKYGTEDFDTLGFQFIQGTDAAGSGAKALNVSRYWYKVGTLTSQATWTQGVLTTPDDIIGVGASVTGGTVITAADADTSAMVIAVDILTSDLDVDGGFDWATIRIEGDGTNNACLISAWAILMGSRFPQLVPLSAIS